jgi:hypothetical protein
VKGRQTQAALAPLPCAVEEEEEEEEVSQVSRRPACLPACLRSRVGMGGWTTRRGPLLLLLLGVCLCPASAFSMAAAGGAMGGAADLYIVGCGYLGKILGKGWLQAHPGCAVVGETNTEGKHEDLKSLGITPALRSARGATKFPNVVFCAPPSGALLRACCWLLELIWPTLPCLSI